MQKKQSNKKNKAEDAARPKTVTGTLDITRSGMGFVVVPGSDNDIMVRPVDFNTALHGDTVTVNVRGDGSRSGRQQGQVQEVVKRKRLEFPGKLQLSKNFAFFIADVDKPMPDIFVPPDKLKGATENDTVIVKITDWQKNKKPVGEVVQIMDAADESDFAMKQILMESGFTLNFPDEVIEESERISDHIPESEIAARKDMRKSLTLTIDPIDAKDFDDAISLKRLENGDIEIGVHIADVSHYIEPDSELDREAFQRATSVYLPDRVLPMLPERISNELCSLRPHEDKLTFSAVFELSPDFTVKKYWLGKTVIHSDQRFSYEEVQETIEKEEGLFKEEILLLNTIAQHYRKQRFNKGAINFSSQEVRFKLDEKGKPIGIVIKESKEAHQLVEELMLLANRTVAEHVGKIRFDKKEVPFPYRVHDTPDEVKLLPFVAFAKKYGHNFDTSSPKGISDSFNLMIKDAQGKPEQHVLEQLGIRTMAKAIYTTENIGHYGLGFPHYCHFTSPIRRYPDVQVHRILLQCLTGHIVPDKKLEQKSKHCSERERSAMESERAANKYKQVEYMKNFLGDEFEGVISGVSGFGFWVETVEHRCEGLVSISSLSDYDDFALLEGDYSLVGKRSGRKFRMGDKLTVKVVAANLTKRQLDYEWVIASKLGEYKPISAEIINPDENVTDSLIPNEHAPQPFGETSGRKSAKSNAGSRSGRSSNKSDSPGARTGRSNKPDSQKGKPRKKK